MAKRRASDVFVECLEAEGVRYVFGIPGEETLDLNESLESSSVQFVPVRHEQGGGYMADAYGRLTRSAGVCLGTLGPGATNLVTPVADAFLNTPANHRMHHDAAMSARGVNFGGILVIWDRLFGSYAAPRRVRAFGIAGSPPPASWRQLYTAPFARTARPRD